MKKGRVGNFLYERETYLIRGACYKIWNEFGGSFKESVIERALIIELEDQGLKTESQKRINIYYKNKRVGVYVPDVIIESKVLVELKSKPFISREDKRQFWLYLKGSPYKLGLLINFSPAKVEIIRRIYDLARH